LNYLIFQIISQLELTGFISIEHNQLKEITKFVFENLSKDDNEFNCNLNKKLIYLAIILADSILGRDIVSKENMVINAYSSFLKKGAHYLRVDSLQVIREIIDEGSLNFLTFDKMKCN
jgi:hypothetical protein